MKLREKSLAAKEMLPNLGGTIPAGPDQPFYFTDLMRRLALRISSQIEYDQINKAPQFRLTYCSLGRATALNWRTIHRVTSGCGTMDPKNVDKVMYALGMNVYDLLDIPKLKEKDTKVKKTGMGNIVALIPAEQSVDRCLRELLDVANMVDGGNKERIVDAVKELSQQFSWDTQLKAYDAGERVVRRVFTQPKPKPRVRPWKNTPAVISNYMAEFGVTRDYVRSFILHELQVYENSTDIASSAEAHVRFKLGCSPNQADRAIGWATKRLE